MVEKLNRRLDIQALRGIAVLAVIFFHAKPNLFPLGYLGVDIFFVISGFIVTPLIIRIQSESLSSRENLVNLKNFYIRRFFRLAPAMGTTLMVVALGIFLFGNLNDHLRFAKQGLITLILLGNLGAYKLSGDYFHHYPNPLIHTWSLSVEEQIYLLLPIIILIMFQKRRILKNRLAKVYFGIISVSLTLFLIPQVMYPIYTLLHFSNPENINYYSPLSRVWEFCLGGLIFIFKREQEINRPIMNLAALGGLTLLIFGPFQLSTTSASAFAAILSAVTIHLSGRHKHEDKFTLTLIWVGDRSYSIYLIHMPIIYFAIYSPSTESQPEFIKAILTLAAIGATILLGNLSYTQIEERFRKPRSKPSILPQPKSMGVGRAVLFFTLLPATIFLLMIFSFNKNYFGLVHIDKPPYAGDQLPKLCIPVNELRDFPCRFIGGKQKKSLVLIGNSHAVHLSIALNDVAQESGYQLYYWGDFSTKQDLAAFLEILRPQSIIISEYWKNETLEDSTGISQKMVNLKKYAKKIIIVGSPPVFPDALQYMNQRSIFSHKYNAPRHFKIGEMDKAAAQSSRVIKDLALRENFEFIDPVTNFCDLKNCWRWLDKNWLYYDDNHLSISGANLLKPLFVSILK